jgi:hypothetical protein
MITPPLYSAVIDSITVYIYRLSRCLGMSIDTPPSNPFPLLVAMVFDILRPVKGSSSPLKGRRISNIIRLGGERGRNEEKKEFCYGVSKYITRK